MAETVIFQGVRDYGDRGHLVYTHDPREVAGCVIAPAGGSQIVGDGVLDGDTTTLTIYAPGGTEAYEGEYCVIRGVEYVVRDVPFDYAYSRRPRHPRHRPRTLITVTREEA